MKDRIELYEELKQYLGQLSDRLDKGSQEYILDIACEIALSSYEKGKKDHKKELEYKQS